MNIRTLMAASVLLGLAAAPALAQSDVPARNPVLGDPGATTEHTARVRGAKSARAHAIARSDKQPPGTQNGNQPDRAVARSGGG